MSPRIGLRVLVVALLTATLALPAAARAMAGPASGRPKDPAVARTDAQWTLENSADAGNDGTPDDDGCDNHEHFNLTFHKSCAAHDSGTMGSGDSAIGLTVTITAAGDNVTKIFATGFANAHATTNAGTAAGSGGDANGLVNLAIDIQANAQVPYTEQFSVKVSAPSQQFCTAGHVNFDQFGAFVSTGAGCPDDDPNEASIDTEGILIPGNNQVVGSLGTDRVEKTTAGAGSRSASTSFSITVTLKAACTIVGTDGNDDGEDNPVIMGTEEVDVICGLEGDDEIKGLGGNDIIHGDAGCLRAEGGPGDDKIFGGTGPEDASCTSALFFLIGGPDNDTIVVDADHEPSALFGDGGVDHITGGSGVDIIQGGGGSDVVHAGAGSDDILGDDSPPPETPTGPPGADALFGDEGKDDIRGGGGSDFIDGGPNPDELDGGPGNFADHIVGGDTAGTAAAALGGDDIIEGGPGNDDIEGGTGGDQIEGSEGIDTIQGEGGRDQLQGGPDDDVISGGPLNDAYLGGPDDDTFFTRDGVAEQVKGGPGHDEATVDGSDVVNSVEVVHRPPASNALR